MPEHGLEGLAVGSDVAGVDGGHDHAGVGHLGGVAAVLADEADDTGADLLCVLKGGDEVGGDVLLEVAAADGEDEEGVVLAQARAAEPFDEDACPALVVGAGGEFGDIVGGGVALDPTDLPEVIDGMGGIGGAAADPEDEEAAAAGAHGGEFLGALFAVAGFDPGDDLGGFLEVLGRVGHGGYI